MVGIPCGGDTETLPYAKEFVRTVSQVLQVAGMQKYQAQARTLVPRQKCLRHRSHPSHLVKRSLTISDLCDDFKMSKTFVFSFTFHPFSSWCCPGERFGLISMPLLLVLATGSSFLSTWLRRFYGFMVNSHL